MSLGTRWSAELEPNSAACDKYPEDLAKEHLSIFSYTANKSQAAINRDIKSQQNVYVDILWYCVIVWQTFAFFVRRASFST